MYYPRLVSSLTEIFLCIHPTNPEILINPGLPFTLRKIHITQKDFFLYVV